ncbi:SAP domain-containing protein [uncultured Methanobrevibacter sp.]|uniref:SAP domain-containing protein n=1 Tax=uncultured Methanobrevibacter sp. TaxID=253161 RepID=UPI00260ADF5E|nr:SAP domain-containing protein [uncultured Methanobrevibacter sp.]
MDFETGKISLKYGDNAPEGYGLSMMQATFDFIYLVYKRDASIDGAVRGVCNEYGLSEDFLMDYLVENKYLLNKVGKKEFASQLKKYNTKALKKILKKHGLKTSGKRDRIEKRILENKLLGNDYYLSSKSRVFYKNKKRRIRIFDKYLSNHYYFSEFNEYYMDNFRKKEEKIPIEYIKQHLKRASEDENHRMYTWNNHIMAELYHDKKNCKGMLEYVLKNFCINLNPVWKIDDLKNHGGLSLETYNSLLFLNNKIGRNRIISAYFYIWDSFNFEKIIVSKYIGYRYLKDILNCKDYNGIVEDLKSNFYCSDDLKIKKITQKTLFDF